jgi:hypothetical protein
MYTIGAQFSKFFWQQVVERVQMLTQYIVSFMRNLTLFSIHEVDQ